MSKINPDRKKVKDELGQMIEDIWDTAKAFEKPKDHIGRAIQDFQFFTPDDVVAISESELRTYWVGPDGQLHSAEVLPQVKLQNLYRAYPAGPEHIVCLSGISEQTVRVYSLKGQEKLTLGHVENDDFVLYTSAFAINRGSEADVYSFNSQLSHIRYGENLRGSSTSDVLEFRGELLFVRVTIEGLVVTDLKTENTVAILDTVKDIEQLVTQVSDTRIDAILITPDNKFFYYQVYKDENHWTSSFIKTSDYSSLGLGDFDRLAIVDEDKLAILFQDTSVAFYNLSQPLCDPEILREVFPECRRAIISKNGTMATESNGIQMKKMQRFHWKRTARLSHEQEVAKRIDKIHLTKPRPESKLIVAGRNAADEPRLWIWTVNKENDMSNPLILTASKNERISFEVSHADEDRILCILYNEEVATMIPVDFTHWKLYHGGTVPLSKIQSLCFFPTALTIATIQDRLFVAQLSELSGHPIKLPNEEIPQRICEGESTDYRSYVRQEVFVSCSDSGEKDDWTKHSIISVTIIIECSQPYDTDIPNNYKERLTRGHPVVLREFSNEIEPTENNQSTVHVEKYEHMYGHTAEIQSLCISKNRKYLISSSVNREIIVWQLWEGYRIQLHKVTCPTEIQLFEFHKNDSLNSLSLAQQESPLREDVESVGISRSDKSLPERLIVTQQHLIVLTQNHYLTVWDLETQACMGSRSNIEAIDYSEENDCVNFWYRKVNKQHFEVDLRPSDSLFGCRVDRCSDRGLVQILLKLSLERPIKYNPAMNSAIFRHNFGVLHLYAYLDMPIHFSKALTDKAPLTVGHNGYNALKVLIKRERKEMIETLFRHLVDCVKSNKYVGQLFDLESLNDLSRLVPHLLPNLFTSFFISIPRIGLPKFAETHSKLPILKSFSNLSEILDFRTELGHLRGVDKPLNQIIQYKQFLFPINSDFLAISLLDYPDKTIFANTVVTLVLDSLWNHAQWFAICKAVFYAVFLVLLTVYALVLPESIGMLIILFVVTSMFLVYELALHCNNKKAYMKERFWNYLNISVSVLYILYFIVTVAISDAEITRYFLIFFMCCAYLRGINYFSSFDKTRYMTFLLEQVVRDIIPFTLLVAYVIVSFAALFSVDDHDADEGYLHNYLSFLYRLGLGEFDTESYGMIKMALFYGSSFFLSIMMLNLLISILGDSFDNVQDNRVSADNIKRTKWILEYDSFKKLPKIRNFVKKKTGTKVYIAQCTKDDKFIVEKWEGWQKNLKVEMHKVTQQAVTELKSMIESYRNESKEDFQELKRMIERMNRV